MRVAPYGPFERRVLRRADAVFVRDEATAQRLREQGVDARAPGNVIVDLFGGEDDPRADIAAQGFVPALALFPGSRQSAYDDARFLARGRASRVAVDRPQLGAVLSIAPLLDAATFARGFRDDGWEVDERSRRAHSVYSAAQRPRRCARVARSDRTVARRARSS